MDITQPNLNTSYHKVCYLLDQLISAYERLLGQYRSDTRLFFEGINKYPEKVQVFEALKTDLQALRRFRDNFTHSRRIQFQE